MAAQLPSEAIGSAVGILIYSLFCLFLSLLLLWLVWVHHERRSYVAMLSFSMSLGTLASIIQQIHTIAYWNDVKTSQYENVVANAGRPELNVTGASTGFDLVLFYIQYYSYNVDAMLVVFWSVELANSILQLRNSRLNRLRGSLWAKASAIILPIIQVCLLRTNVVQGSVFGFMVLADFIMVISFGIGSLLLFAILIKYIHSRAALVSWKVRYGQNSSKTTNPYSGSGNVPSGHRPSALPRRNIYDSWLAVRFTVAFVALGLFELVVIFFQLRAANTNTKANIPPHPDLSAARARGDFALFCPGVSASLLIFIVFGTTRTFREYVWTRFAPQLLQDRVAARKALKKQKTPPNQGQGETMAPPVILSTFQIGVRRNSSHHNSPGAANSAAAAGGAAYDDNDDLYKGVQTLTTINGHKYRTGPYTPYIRSTTPSPCPSPSPSPGPGSEVDLEMGIGNGGQYGGGHGGSYDEGSSGGGGGKQQQQQQQQQYLQTGTTSFGVVGRSTSRTDDDDVPILKKAMPAFQRGSHR
ncbi:hypothetical protein GE21DRAFT_6482 [Neurospora crassa]|uniref:Glycoside hydrolase n=1 Tax=Neurospora crassa (strain ATCC 24698 / 74-OR23-1A / CBS 708.71 / DSM 1257 / FGSC 987) TaxID=367110 RepID=Q7SAF9_NEUCR|nr:hypothetical protein NCU06991 [Neurospora crassa OR74A]EAA33395.2 hypothetical protein NCU06991 [Neurospora crassa OR74A]KHE79345.1 hypothetical protein GE21DRAFT_6482 [Neurospora crassa]|eukprot:XP_962631.2 hypothetical protein NCU06991 [Neurospora crassa OR74A]